MTVNDLYNKNLIGVEMLGRDKKEFVFKNLKSTNFGIESNKKAFESNYLYKFTDISMEDFKTLVSDTNVLADVEVKYNKEWSKRVWENGVKSLPTDDENQIRKTLSIIEEFRKDSRAKDFVDEIAGEIEEVERDLKGLLPPEQWDVDWDNLDKSDYPALRGYHNNWPDYHVSECDEYMWAAAKRIRTVQSVSDYLTDWENENGKYVEDAKSLLEKLRILGSPNPDIFVVWKIYRGMMSNDVCYDDFRDLAFRLKVREIDIINGKGNAYPNDKLKKLLDEKIIDESDITIPVIPPIPGIGEEDKKKLREKLEKFQLPNPDIKALPDCTDIYMFGVSSTGKTCLFMGIAAGSGHESEYLINGTDTKIDGSYYSDVLADCGKSGVLPPHTETEYICVINGDIFEKKGHRSIVEHKVNFIEMAGEKFRSKFAMSDETDFEKIDKREDVEMSDLGVGINNLLNNDNRKIFFLIVDPTANKIDYYDYKEKKSKWAYQSSILGGFCKLFRKPENQGFMEKVDEIHFIVTKADVLGDDDEVRLKNAKSILKNDYADAVGQIEKICRDSKRINKSTGYIPFVFTFSLGMFGIGGYKYNPKDSVKLINTIKCMSGGRFEVTFWDKFKKLISE